VHLALNVARVIVDLGFGFMVYPAVMSITPSELEIRLENWMIDANSIVLRQSVVEKWTFLDHLGQFLRKKGSTQAVLG
jgi:hypothetical protein